MINLIIGEMFSGKTTELFRRLNRYKHAGYKVMLFKYAKDVRFGEERAYMASSHDNIHEAAIPITSVRTIDPPPVQPEALVIGFDEGQFIDGIEIFAEKAANMGHIVEIAGLCSDFRRKSFKRMQKLIPKAENIDKFHAICHYCKKDSSFTQIVDEGDGEQEQIGGEEKYRPVCRACYNESIARDE